MLSQGAADVYAPRTVGDWLSAHERGVPHPLRARMREAMGDALARVASDAPACFIEAGERTLAKVLSADPQSRDTALDLLAVDALLTYAFEAASERPEELEELSRQAMERIARMAPAADTPH